MKKLSRKLLSVLLIIAILIPTSTMMLTSNATDSSIEIGDYITLGTYYGEPIVWRCVDIDENGPLMLSDKILCLKAFDANGENSTYHSDGWGWIRKNYGSNCWFDSNIRQWLNTSGTVDFTHCSPTAERVYGGYNAYADEEGFLTEFTSSELSMIKTVTQKCYINSYETQRSGYWDGGTKELNYAVASPGKDYSSYYYQNVTDMIFFLNPCQVDSVYASFKDYLLNAYPTKQAVENSNYINEKLSADLPWSYWLGMAGNTGASYEHQYRITNIGGTDNYSYKGSFSGSIGVRPAFYLDVDAWETSYAVTGVMTGSSTDNRIAIDGTWYEYDTSVPGLAEAIDRFAINENITCKIKFGKIVACSKTEINNTATLSVNSSTNSVTYNALTKKYNPEKIALSLNVTNGIVGTQRGTISTEYVAGYDITFDKLVIDVYDGDMLYFKDGWFGLGKTQKLEKKFDSPVTLKAGETFNFNEDLNAIIDDDYKWGDSELKKDIRIFAYAYEGDNVVAMNTLNITFKNQSAEDNIKNQAEFNNKIQATANLLNNTSCVIQNEFLSEIFTKEELKDISNALQCKVALYAATIDFSKNETFEEKLIKKLLKKANIDKDWIGTAYTADISLVVEVDTEEYGRIEVEFNVPMTYYVLGGGQSNSGISFNMSYKIKGGKGIPSDKKSGDILGALTYANISSFVSSVQDVALDQIESAYDLGYGDDLNKVCEMFFGETMTKILSKTAAKSYSHLTFSMMTFPSKQVKIHCPVDVYVYDSEGILCASVESNEITMTCDDIDIEVIGDEKYLTIYDGDYSIEIIATANDEMDITIEEYSSTDEMISTTSFDNVALTPGDSFKTDIDENYLDSDYQISKNDEDNIIADSNEEYIHYIDSVEIIDKDATCTEDGEYHIECAECKETVLTGTIPATEHSDANHDGVCDDCTEDFTTNCKCNCHSNAFMQFLHKILCFLYRIFGMDQYRYCNCGKAHW